MRRLVLGLSTLALSVVAAGDAGAQIRTIGGAPAVPGDDNNTAAAYGFGVNYFGVTYDAGTVCTNGYLILGGFAPSGNCAYPGGSGSNPPTISGLRPLYEQVMAPFFSDLNLAFPGSGPLLVGQGLVGSQLAWAATWLGVEGYAAPPGSNVTFQLALLDDGAGDFTMEFNYGDLDFLPEGGVGFTNATTTYTLPGAVENSRYSCQFRGGALAGCSFSTVPEPSTVVLLGSGLLAVLGVGARRRRLTAQA